MKKAILIALPIFTAIALVGCGPKEEEETTIDDVTIEKVEVKEEDVPQTDEELLAAELQAEAEFQDTLTEPLGYAEDDENFQRGAVIELSPLKDIKNPEQFKADLDSYLIYCFPNIDHRYNAEVINGSEEDKDFYYVFKVKVEGINEDGSDLVIKCLWMDSVATEHYNFFSDITPDGTEIRVDQDGNVISWEY